MRMPLRRVRRHRLVPVDMFTQLTSTLETAVRERSFGALDVDRPSRASIDRPSRASPEKTRHFSQRGAGRNAKKGGRGCRRFLLAERRTMREKLFLVEAVLRTDATLLGGLVLHTADCCSVQLLLLLLLRTASQRTAAASSRCWCCCMLLCRRRLLRSISYWSV